MKDASNQNQMERVSVVVTVMYVLTLTAPRSGENGERRRNQTARTPDTL